MSAQNQAAVVALELERVKNKVEALVNSDFELFSKIQRSTKADKVSQRAMRLPIAVAHLVVSSRSILTRPLTASVAVHRLSMCPQPLGNPQRMALLVVRLRVATIDNPVKTLQFGEVGDPG
jgi:hypothetical protein